MTYKKINLLLIGSVPPPPLGTSNLNKILIDNLKNDLFSIILLDTSDRREKFNFGKLDIVNIFLALKHLIMLIFYLSYCKIDIVYLTVSTSSLGYFRDGLFICIAKLFHNKIVIHSHGRENRTFYDNSGKFMRYFIFKTLNFTDKAICEGEIVREEIFKGLLPQERVISVPNGIKDLFSCIDFDYHRKNLNTNSKEIIVSYIAHMWEPKGYLEIIKLIPRVIDKYRNIKFIFAGRWANDKEREKAINTVSKLELQNYVKFLGLISEKQKYDLLLNSHIFAFPTMYKTEGQPLSILEAMSAALPIISSNIGCIPENIPNNTHGILINPGDSEELYDALQLLVNDRILRIKLGLNNRKRFLTYYQDISFVKGIENVFINVINTAI